MKGTSVPPGSDLQPAAPALGLRQDLLDFAGFLWLELALLRRADGIGWEGILLMGGSDFQIDVTLDTATHRWAAVA